jgi:hypothetical protein
MIDPDPHYIKADPQPGFFHNKKDYSNDRFKGKRLSESGS